MDTTVDRKETDNDVNDRTESAGQSSIKPILIIVMGVSGCGKSTLAENLGKSLSMPSLDADSLHPKHNVDKMSAGEPLTDEDRAPWLSLVRTTVENICAEQDNDPDFKGRRGVVVACSALKKKYRALLRGEDKSEVLPGHLEPPHPHAIPTYFVFLKGQRETLFARMHSRQGHFMKSKMLDSQLATLESPEGEDGVVVVVVEDPPEQQLASAREGLAHLAGSFD